MATRTTGLVNLPLPESFEHCPRCGTRSTRSGASKRFLCSSCDYCFFFNPACAVAALIVAPDHRMVFIRRNRNPSKGKLSLPGGFVDPGASAENALKRETREEVSLELVEMEFLCSHPNQYSYRGLTYPVTDFFFVATVAQFDSMSPEPSEVAEIHLSPVDELAIAQAAFPSVAFALRRYLAIDAR